MLFFKYTTFLLKKNNNIIKQLKIVKSNNYYTF